MSYRVQIARLNLCDSNIPPNANHAEVDSCAERLLLMLEVERREYCIKSKSYGGQVICRKSKDYTKELFLISQIFRTL